MELQYLQNKKKQKMIRIICILFFQILSMSMLLTSTFAQSKYCIFESSTLLEVIPPYYDIRKPIDIDSFDRNKLLLLDSIQYLSVYQIDSLVKDYQKRSDFSYVIGKNCFQKYSELYILRIYGNWLKTVEFLTYDNDAKLKGFLILESKGGEHDFSLLAKSTFSIDNQIERINLVKIYEDKLANEQKCLKLDSTYSKFKLNEFGIINQIESKNFTGNCK